MKRFNVGAPRNTTGEDRMSAAQELVQRTLAQHGLAGPEHQGLPMSASLDGMLSGLNFPLGGLSQPELHLPEGATFARDTYSCDAGSRAYRTYVPAAAQDGVTGVVVMLHGCTQTPEDFAAGTGMNALAELHRFVVVYPAQARGDNAQSCWNWFSRGDQRRDAGEPAILSGITRQVRDIYNIERDRTFVAGLSAGAAMAIILGETYSDVFTGVGAHSGLPFGAAKDVPSAFAAMSSGAQSLTPRNRQADPVRTIVFHGTSDSTVHPSNGASIVQQALDVGPSQTIEATQSGQMGGRGYTCRVSTGPSGRAELEHWTIDGLGHAWSGGQPSGSYTDPKGPDASAEMVRFFFSP
ncbi:alpha/beta hydrolase family esterase [Marivita sp. S2033]|uniref:extracellular catalytic domain type 1 short-chain-length polyhydroxyalkanoate depolymerase n=1 Tax=Marivita sp. S2033 TaxID=3373187 RepID=UPI003982CF7B